MAACSLQRQGPQKDEVVDTSDPFQDPFFTQSPEWDDSVLRQSEVLAQDEKDEQGEKAEAEKSGSFFEKSEGVIFSTVMVGMALGKLALPFFGLGF
jgi:hypothetical protein